MINLEHLRANPALYKKAAKDKQLTVDIDAFLKIDEKRRGLIPHIEEKRNTKNEASKKIQSLDGDEKEKAIIEMQMVNTELKKEGQELKEIEEEWKAMQLQLPSIPHPDTPIGKDDSDNVEVEKWGDVSVMLGNNLPSDLRDHVELGEALDIIDIPRGVKVSGSRNYYLKGDGARLHRAVLNFTMDHLAAKGWTLFSPPLMATYECFMGTGFFPGVDQTNIYEVGGRDSEDAEMKSDGVHLIGTSEVTVASYHSGETLKESDLPKRYAGYSVCFRREAGTYGKDTRGLYRVHQFEKVEQVVLCRADEEEGMKLFYEIRKNAEEILQALKLPYRIVSCCTGDMGKAKVFMQDIETWMPSREAYGETHSCSYLGSFQSRRMGIKYEKADGSKEFVHTLNNTCIASPRILIPILEMYQNEDGSVTVPEVLRSYMGGQEVIN